MIQKTLKEIAALVGGKVIGDQKVVITGIAGIREAQPGDITFIANPKYRIFLDKTNAAAVITTSEVQFSKKPLIHTDNPSLAFTKLVSVFVETGVNQPKGIHLSAVIGKNVKLGKDVSIGPCAILEDGVSIMDNTVIYGSCYIAENSCIGSNTVIYPLVSIGQNCVIGNKVIIHSGTVVGSDGFGFVTAEGRHHKIPQVGIVVIEDEVEIGANVAIDRARFDKTVIGQGTKIDNLVHIAHNVTIGKNCLIVAQVGISGSTSIGNNVILAGQAGLVGHISLGDNVVVMAQSGVSKSIPADTTVWGYPAKPETTSKKVNACVQNLPKLYDAVNTLKKRLELLEQGKKADPNEKE